MSQVELRSRPWFTEAPPLGGVPGSSLAVLSLPHQKGSGCLSEYSALLLINCNHLAGSGMIRHTQANSVS